MLPPCPLWGLPFALYILTLVAAPWIVIIPRPLVIEHFGMLVFRCHLPFLIALLAVSASPLNFADFAREALLQISQDGKRTTAADIEHPASCLCFIT
jgi:hypothetical protein